MRLKPFQVQGVSQLHKLFKKHTKVCLAWYTGAGKTNVFSQFLKESVEKNPNIKIGISAYLTTEIRDQIMERLSSFGLADQTQVICSGLPREVVKPIVIFNPQAVHRRPLQSVTFDIFVVDESHAGMSDSCVMLKKIFKVNCNKKTKILLVSATPWDTLSQPQFKDIPVLKRPLDQGLQDGLITDFQFHAEEAQIEFKEDDFSRTGDLKKSSVVNRMSILKSVCEGKVKHIVKKYDKILGKKVMVICPPGNYGEIPRHLARELGGLPFLEASGFRSAHGPRNTGLTKQEYDTKDNLKKWMEGDERFLFVINKCGTGFDYQNLVSIVDLTMSRNIKTLAQRIGRVGRRSGDLRKNYFYVYDRSLLAPKLEWLIATMIDFSLGAYDGWTTKNAKYRKVYSGQFSPGFPYSASLKEIVMALRDDCAIEKKRILSFVDRSPPTLWTLDLARSEAAKYKDRTDLWYRRPALYKWFRLNAKEEMDRIFPLKHKLGKWNEETVLSLMKKCSKEGMGRKKFHDTYSGAEYWLKEVNPVLGKQWMDKYLPSKFILWDETKVTEKLKEARTWAHLRNHGGLRKWMQFNGGTAFWLKRWEEMHGRQYVPRRGRTGVKKKK